MCQILLNFIISTYLCLDLIKKEKKRKKKPIF